MPAKNTVKQGVDQGARLASAVERVMRPFIRLIVGRVSCGFLVQQVKRIYIEEARASIRKNDPEARVTKSKLAMLTGLDTRTISNFEESAQPAESARIGDLCAEAAVLGTWNSDMKYRDENEQPKILPILGKGSSFQTLVSSTIGRNVTCQTVLEKLEQSRNVEIIDQNLVKLVNPFYQAIKESEGVLIEYGSLSTSRLLDTINHNFHAELDDSRRLQQDRLSRRVKKSDVRKLENEIREMTDAQILAIENILIRYEQPENCPDMTTFGIGWFFFSEVQVS